MKEKFLMKNNVSRETERKVNNMKEIKIIEATPKQEEIEQFEEANEKLKMMYNMMMNIELYLSDYGDDIDYELIYEAVDSIADLRKAIVETIKKLKEGE